MCVVFHFEIKSLLIEPNYSFLWVASAYRKVCGQAGTTSRASLPDVVTLQFATMFQSGAALCFEGTVFHIQNSKEKKVFNTLKKSSPSFCFNKPHTFYLLIAQNVSIILFYIKPIFILV